MLSRDMFCREKLGLNGITYCMTIILNMFRPFMEDMILGDVSGRLTVTKHMHWLVMRKTELRQQTLKPL